MKVRNYSLEQIKALIVEGTDLLVITSPTSFDKNALSRLSRQVESIRATHWKTSLILASPGTTIESLSREIIEQALPDQSKDKLPVVSQVHKYLEYSAHNGLMPVIMIDNAHELSLEVLEFILQLAELRYAESLFRIVLFADETINEHLDVPKLKKLTTGVLHNIHTTSFAKEETVGNIDNVSIDEADEYLIEDEVIRDKTENESSRSHVGVFTIAIGLIFASLIYFYLTDQKNVDVADSTTFIQSQEVISEKAESQVEQGEEIEEDVQELGEDNVSIDDQVSMVIPEPSIEEGISENILDIETTEAEEITETPYDELPEYIEEVESHVVEEVLMLETEDKNVFNLNTAPDFLSNVRGPAWLRQQPANSYVLQLLSARYMSNIKNLLSGQSGIQDNLSGYVKYTPSGKPRYLLLYGIYPDRKAAEAAINELPVKLQLVNPWPRAIDDVIKELDKISEPFIEIEEGIEIPLGEFSGEIEKIEIPAIVEVQKDLMPTVESGNAFNLETVPDIVSGIKGPTWLRQQPANSYVLQLLSARYMSNIKNLLSGQSGIQDNLSGYVKYTPSGKPRYLLLYGIYPDRKAAVAAINELPVKLQLANPWPRKLGDAIKEINKISEPLIDDELSESILGLG